MGELEVPMITFPGASLFLADQAWKRSLWVDTNAVVSWVWRKERMHIDTNEKLNKHAKFKTFTLNN